MTPADSNAAGAIVIGAGLSGLATARALKRRGMDVRILDQALHAGDAWRHRHPGLRLNTHRWLSSLPGLPMPRAAGAFPSRDHVIRYLEAYAAFIDVPVHYGVTVRRVDPEPVGWRIDTDAGPFRTDHVVVATGRDRVPHIPGWAGLDGYRGTVRHAADFGAAGAYEGKRILVVGAGNSGTDVLNHLAGVRTRQVWVSVRRGPAVFPTRLGGVPIQPTSILLERLPAPLVDRMLALTERIAFGDLSRRGLPRHRQGGATRLITEGTAPAIDNGFVRCLKQGRAGIVPAIESFGIDHVHLVDGQRLEPDAVVCATGYRTGLHAMLGHLGVLDERGAPAIEGAEQDPRYPGLWFTGMRPRLSGYFVAARRNSVRISRAVRAMADRPHRTEPVSLEQASP